MILVYTGNGKGKTSACAGQALRALGQNFDVFFAQFMKSDCGAGEQLLLGRLLGDAFYCNGKGFYRGRQEEFPAHRAAAEETLAWARERLNAPRNPERFAGRMLILDEALYALNNDLLQEDELRGLISLCCEQNAHLVLSGRGLPDWLKAEADLVSEIIEVKHPMNTGCKAAPGIEF